MWIGALLGCGRKLPCVSLNAISEGRGFRRVPSQRKGFSLGNHDDCSAIFHPTYGTFLCESVRRDLGSGASSQLDGTTKIVWTEAGTIPG
jgi:hypothetical protein